MSDDTADKPVAIAAYGRAIAAALEQRGIDAAKVFESAGVSLPTTSDPMRRMSNAEISSLFRESFKLTRDPYFGLFIAESFHITNLHALGFALLASSTLRDFCLRLQNYYHLASQNVAISLLESGGESMLATKLLNLDICWETVDAFAAMMVRLMRAVGDPQMTPTRVELVRPKPAEGDQPYRDYFSCDVLFDRPEIRIGIDSALIDKPLAGASVELAQMHDKTAMEYLAKLKRQDISGRVRVVIVDNLSTGMVSKKLVADKLHISLRNLELKLSRENTNFQQVLDSTRQSLAAGYIEQSSFAITEIAYMLGFSDAANFTRAFKRWTGKSPLGFRKSLGLSHRG
jgi:AraC-like DNA-binding protein